SGRPTVQQAEWWFDETVAPRPRVHVPTGAVGIDRSGTAAIKALSRYSSRLSARQRAVLERLLHPHRAFTIDPNASSLAQAAAAGAPAGVGDLPAIIAEALRRLKAHGVIFHHGISLETRGKDSANEYAHSQA